MITKGTIKITWLEDEYYCDDCGESYAQGATITLDGKEIVTLIPSAHCYGGHDYSRDDVYITLLETLGYTVDEGF
jgi:hypothetical protein